MGLGDGVAKKILTQLIIKGALGCTYLCPYFKASAQQMHASIAPSPQQLNNLLDFVICGAAKLINLLSHTQTPKSRL